MKLLPDPRSHSTAAVVMLMTLAIVFPPAALAQGQAPRAGQFVRLVQKAEIQRAGKVIPAAVNAAVFWQDTMVTDRNGRARIDLEDGSTLNVGSESSLTVAKHDSGAQQTELDLAYGKVRANVVKIARPGGEFKVKTRTAVAGVVGTDFFLSFINGITQLLVFEGIVQFCNLAGQCVAVGAGFSSAIRGNNAPDQPTNISPSQSVHAGQSTQVAEAAAAGAAAGGVSTFTVLAIVGAVVASVVVATTVTRGDGTQKSPRCCPQTAPTQRP